MIFIKDVRVEIMIESDLENAESFVCVAILNDKVQQRLTILQSNIFLELRQLIFDAHLFLETEILLKLLAHQDCVHFLIIVLNLQGKLGLQVFHSDLGLFYLGGSKTDLVEAEDFVALPISITPITFLKVLFEVADTFSGGA